MAENQYDTIYHEHFSYFSLITVEKIFAAHGLVLFDVDEIPTHGGSIRIYLRQVEDSSKPVTPAVVTSGNASSLQAWTGWRPTQPLRNR